MTHQANGFSLFPKLPKEIQEQILLQIIDVDGSVHFDRPVYQQPTKEVGLHHNSGCCLRCTDMLDFCACPVRHAAYTTNGCKCWQYPIDLFLVNKEFNRLVKRLFYSETRFHVWDTCPEDHRDGYLERISGVLSRFQNPCWLSLSFRSFRCTDCLPENKAEYDAWGRLARFIKSFRTDELTLVLYLQPMIPEFDCYPKEVEDQHKMWLTQQNVVKHFEGLKLRDFFVFLSFPVWYELTDDKLRWDRERLLEKRIMGKDYIPGSRKYQYSFINEEKGPRNFWFQYMEISSEQAEQVELDDPEKQQKILDGSLKEFLETIKIGSLRRRGIDLSVRDEYDAPEAQF